MLIFFLKKKKETLVRRSLLIKQNECRTIKFLYISVTCLCFATIMTTTVTRIIVKFVLDLFRILKEIDDHGIIVKMFIEFDQNSVSQPYNPDNPDDYIILQELYDHRILVKSFISIRILLASLIIQHFK